MAEESEELSADRWNYFNYFTEVEEHFQKVRGTSLFLMSPLDWTLVEHWKNSGIPLEAVLRGIDQAFEKWHAKKHKQKLINSLTYCAQAVQEEAEAMAGSVPITKNPAAPPFTPEELEVYLRAKAEALAVNAQFAEVAKSLLGLAEGASESYTTLEQLEQKLTALEEKLAATVRSSLADEELFGLREEVDSLLRPYRARMTASQLTMLEKQYTDRRIREKAGLPRLSLFYM